ncbi:hypothetical protein [Neorhodopirellula lusitana]|uniref:hypothetical protein n=1 Tax=Neorhodopirellula lusitana TaxID=445327 RepID=UPI00384BBDC4
MSATTPTTRPIPAFAHLGHAVREMFYSLQDSINEADEITREAGVVIGETEPGSMLPIDVRKPR